MSRALLRRLRAFLLIRNTVRIATLKLTRPFGLCWKHAKTKQMKLQSHVAHPASGKQPTDPITWEEADA